MGFLEALTLVFIALKLMGFIAWSWWWVLSPIIISFTVYAVMAVCFISFIIYKALRPSKHRYY